MRIRAIGMLMIAALLGAGASLPASAAACVNTPDNEFGAPRTQDIEGEDTLDAIEGHYVLPATATPKSMVVYMHGYRNRSASWICHLRDAAENHGAVAVAVDYTGTGPAPDNRGWFVKQGAEDAIIAAQYFLERFPTIRTVGILGVSMGGNASGLAVASRALRPNGDPLFDYWVDVEGVANVIETYATARAVGPVNAYAAGAAEDIEQATGGTPNTAAAEYAAITLVQRAEDIARSGIQGVAVVHGAADGLVPYNQSRELVARLRASNAGAGLPTDMYTVTGRGSGEAGTTVSGYLLNPAGQGAADPFAGHGWEGSSSHVVIKTGFKVFWDLMEGRTSAGNREFLVDGDADPVGLP